MKKYLYLIPGLDETTEDKNYQKFIFAAKEKNYEVVSIKPNWEKSFSEQVPKIEAGSVVIGYSLGAIFAHLIAVTQPCKKVILASMTPVFLYSEEDLKEALGARMAKELKSLSLDFINAENVLYFYNTFEVASMRELDSPLPPNLITVEGNDHELTAAYVKQIVMKLQ